MATDALLRRRRHPPPTTTTTTPSVTNSGNQSLSSNNHGADIADNSNTDHDDNDRPGMTVTVSSKHMYQRIQHLDEYAWFIIFLSALSYLIAARSSGGSSSRGGLFSNLVAPYEVVPTSVMVFGSDESGGRGDNISENEKVLKSIFYIDDNNPLQGNENDGNNNASSTMMLALQRGSQLEVVLSSDLDVNMGGIGNGLVGTHDVDECTASSGVDEYNNNGTNKNNDDYDKSSKPTQPRQQLSSPPPRPFLSHITSTTWVHDPDLGRGYLLINDAGRSGRIWRWEVGGGPISIGKTLHMERSGCRSGLWVEEGNYDGDIRSRTKSTKAGTCPENLKGDLSSSSLSERLTKSSSLPPLLGSASIAVEPSADDDGKKNLAVAEWGERRIVRVEEGTGARTPLATLVPIEEEEDNRHDNEDIAEQHITPRRRRRLYRPNHLTYTQTGDLLFSDSFAIEGEGDQSNHRQVGVVYRKKGAVHIPPISVDQSRDAHAWIRTTGKEDEEGEDDDIEVLLQLDGWIEGISLGLDHATLYVLAVVDRTDQIGFSNTVYKLRIGGIYDDDDDDEDSEDDTDNKVKEDDAKVAVFYETSSSDCKHIDNIDSIVRDEPFPSTGSKLAVDKTGTLYLISCHITVTLLSRQGQMIGDLALDHSRGQSPTSSRATHLTSIGFGADGYIYITSVNELMRVKSRVGGLSMPANIILPSSLKR